LAQAKPKRPCFAQTPDCTAAVDASSFPNFLQIEGCEFKIHVHSVVRDGEGTQKAQIRTQKAQEQVSGD
jgi:hypothetical protein